MTWCFLSALWTRVLIAGLLLGGLLGPAHACTWRWQPVTEFMDGRPIDATADIVSYRLLFQPEGSTTPEVIALTTDTTVTLLCPAGTYWVTAKVENRESAVSAPIVIKPLVPIGADTSIKRGSP